MRMKVMFLIMFMSLMTGCSVDRESYDAGLFLSYIEPVYTYETYIGDTRYEVWRENDNLCVSVFESDVTNLSYYHINGKDYLFNGLMDVFYECDTSMSLNDAFKQFTGMTLDAKDYEYVRRAADKEINGRQYEMIEAKLKSSHKPVYFIIDTEYQSWSCYLFPMGDQYQLCEIGGICGNNPGMESLFLLYGEPQIISREVFNDIVSKNFPIL